MAEQRLAGAGHGVVSALGPGVAAQDAACAQQAAAKGAMPGDRFLGVVAAAGFEPAIRADDRPQRPLIERDQRPQQPRDAGDGLLPWSEVAAICAKRTVPLMPFGTSLATVPLKVLGGADFNPETIDLLKYGRGIDNRRLVDAGFRYHYTSAGTVAAFAEAMRLRNTVGDQPGYRYETDVEQFFRHSPAVVRDRA